MSELRSVWNRKGKKETIRKGRYQKAAVSRCSSKRYDRANISSGLIRQCIFATRCRRSRRTHKRIPNAKKPTAAGAILKGIFKLELSLGKTLERYHSDNAKEQRTKELLTQLQSKGTQVKSTAPHSCS